VGLKSYAENPQNHEDKFIIKELIPRTEGYLFFSTMKKAKKPTNLLLKLAFLIENG